MDSIIADFVQIVPEEVSGIYFFISIDHKQIYYIGQSKNISKRYATHEVKYFLISEGIDFVFLWRNVELQDLNSAEKQYIQELKPLLNRSLNPDKTLNDLCAKYLYYMGLYDQPTPKVIPASEGMLNLVRDLSNSAVMHIGMETKESYTYAMHRVSSLLNAIESGKYFLALRDIFKNVPNTTDIVTDMGTYKGWGDFISKNNLSMPTVNRYIFMYEHRQEFEELKLLSLDPEDIDSGASGHRKIAACDAVKWYLKLIEEQGDAVRNTVTAADYQKYKNEQQLKASPSVDNITLSLEEYFNLRAELTTLRQQVESLMAELTIERSKQ